MSNVLYEATITAAPEIFGSLKELDLDIQPGHREGPAGEIIVSALLDENELAEVESRGARVEVRDTVDARFPRDMIMSEEEVQARILELVKLKNRDR